MVPLCVHLAVWMVRMMEGLAIVWLAQSTAKLAKLQQIIAYPAIVWEEWDTILTATNVLRLAQSITMQIPPA